MHTPPTITAEDVLAALRLATFAQRMAIREELGVETLTAPPRPRLGSPWKRDED